MKKFGIVVLFAAIVAAPAAAQLTWFTTQAAFDAANSGNILDGIEDYEASTLLPGQVLGMADPLSFGIPNGTAYPNGTQGYAGVSTQSNLGGGAPGTVNPRGANGLAAAAIGFAGAVSDVIIANTFVDSLDYIFAGGQVSVGADSLTFLGGATVDVRVYDTANNFLGQMTFSANPAGTNFMGVISTASIGRVNVFDSAGGAEGLDNIQAYSVPEPASLGLFLVGGLALLRRRG